jgi:hypothetical protein
MTRAASRLKDPERRVPTRNRKPKGARLEFLKGCAFREKLKIDFRFFGFSNGNQTPQTAWMPSQTPATVERR